MTNTNGDGRLPLSEVLAEVAESFRSAREVGLAHKDGPVLGWHGATLEIETALTRDASGRVRAWVVEAGGGVVSGETAKITVHLLPHGDVLGIGGM